MTDHDSIDSTPIDSDLVAFAHGELHGADRAAVQDRLRSDPDARARLAVIESVEVALAETLDRDQAPRPAAATFRLLRPLLALAAAAVVIAVINLRGEGAPETDAATARNDHIELRIGPADGATAPLFTDAALTFHWERKSDGIEPRPTVLVVPFPFGQTVEKLGAEIDRTTNIGSRRSKVLPLVITATIRSPEGKELQARYAPSDVGEPLRILPASLVALGIVRLRDFEVALDTPRPAFVGNPGDREWRDDAMWKYTHMAKDKQARCFPELPGTWKFEVRVDTLPAPEFEPWPEFTEPLVVKSAIIMTGEVSDWGEANDGMRARLVWSSGVQDADRSPFALQLRNDSGRDRKYNHIGTTIAKIPQPQHYTLLVDGEEWQQTEGVPVVITAADLMPPHASGTFCSFVTRPGYWQRDGKSLQDLPGKHRVQVLFHFKPSVWNAADKSLWMGKLLTPELEIEVPAPR